MTDLTFDRFGIWTVKKREKSGLEGLGFYNSYAGIDQLKCLIVRLDNFEIEAMKLGVAKMNKLLVRDKERFIFELDKINTQIKTAKKIYQDIDNTETYNLNYIKSLSDVGVYKLRKRAHMSSDLGKIKQLIDIKEAIEKIVKDSSKPLDRTIDLKPVSEIEPLRERQDYTPAEDNYIIENFTVLPARQIAAHLGRTKDAVTSRMRRLREEGRI